MNIEEAKSKLRRKAIVLEIGGFKPPESNSASWFGKALLGREGETWPESNSVMLHALCQINLLEMPFRPPRLEDIEFITVFINPDELPFENDNGENWCLRAYKSIDDLVPLPQVNHNTYIKPFPMRPHVIENDYPCWEDVNIDLPQDIEDNYYDYFETAEGFKLGGWPSLVQSEIFWAPYNKHPASPEYVFQIDSSAKANWMWGDSGVGYFGRGTIPGMEDIWTCEWQCY